MLHDFDDIEIDEDLPKFGPGRPEKIVDLAIIERLAGIGCTKQEIAAVFGIARSTLYDHLARNPEIAAAIERGAGRGKATLRRMQWKGAHAGNPTMLIWLGKQLLGQRDSHALQRLDKNGNPTDAMRVVIELVGDPAPPRIEATERDTGLRLPKDARDDVQLVG
jgi:hypothetical protein